MPLKLFLMKLGPSEDVQYPYVDRFDHTEELIYPIRQREVGLMARCRRQETRTERRRRVVSQPSLLHYPPALKVSHTQRRPSSDSSSQKKNKL
ncbi:hypothetical protein EYF80_048191 [Liparis tanakae]|uniref:Uncharacterized protein n=1 Tax=Liparis tanakae TaxID=230148 RepID=A0A4Z2FKU8_9TELE|nr:hypothetical protein EYF80_048191 [Liparis tanakae]